MSTSILERIAARDPDAVRLCLDRFGGLVWSLARRMTRTPADAEDAVQDIFLAVWRSAGRYDPKSASETTFIAMIARRRLIDRLRAQARGPNTASLEAAGELGSLQDAAHLEQGVDAARALRAFQALRPNERRVVELAVVQGLSHREIATATGLPLGTVKTHARRGLLRVRNALAEPTTAALAETGP